MAELDLPLPFDDEVLTYLRSFDPPYCPLVPSDKDGEAIVEGGGVTERHGHGGTVAPGEQVGIEGLDDEGGTARGGERSRVSGQRRVGERVFHA